MQVTVVSRLRTNELKSIKEFGCNVLVAADGVQSSTRARFIPDDERRYVGVL